MDACMTGRVAVITGACGGVGSATADAFAAEGWYVVGIDRSAPTEHVRLDRFVQADLANDSELDRIRHDLADLDHVDALVNNAAVQINVRLVDTTDEQWDQTMAVNVRAAFRMIRSFHDALAMCRGAVVNVGSVHSIATSPSVAAYAVSKGSLAALTRSAALELAADGIRCNAVLPGAVLTPMLTDGLSRRPHPDGPDGNLAALIARTPLGFVAQPAHIASSIVFLADTAKSPYTTGQTLVVDGGATLRLGTE
jgi:NAD(P)-dependent dehydrogenase (short-subunit alcohol dehydrogenase family)